MGSEKRDLEPVLLKFVVPLALSMGGILYSLITNKRSKASKSLHDIHTRSDCNNQMNSRSNHQSPQTPTISLHFDPLSTDKRGLHDIEFKGYPRSERDTNEQEIKNLRNSVRILKERERNLEIELLEYYGQKEQETAVMELQNRLKLNNMEAKLYALRIESLQAENKRLQAQMSDYTKAITDLEAARAKIKMLKKMHKSEVEQHKKQLLDFQQRIQKIQDNEHKHVVKVDPDFELSRNKLNILEAEVDDLKKSNHGLELEKSDLERRLDCVQMLATSVLEDSESEKVKEESEILRKQNEDLSNEVEQLRADRCADAEELVYTKWLNACLRHELRNYKPGPNQTSARDLSKSLSPKSEQKAKQMILEYANKEAGGEDSARLSLCSTMTDSIEIDESFIDDSLPHKSNNKFFGKLIRLLRGKDKHKHNHKHRTLSRNSSANPRLRTSSVGSSNDYNSMDSRQLTRRHSDVCFYKQIDSIDEDCDDDGRSCTSSTYSKSTELAKYADVLKETSPAPSPAPHFKLHRSSSSLDNILS